MPIIKGPQQVGDELTSLIRECKEVKGKFGQQVAFELENGDTLFLPAKSAARQLIRTGFDDGSTPPRADYEAVGGNTLTFGREENPNGKPYWSVTVADGMQRHAAKQPASKRVPSPGKVSDALPTRVPGDEPPDWHKDVPPAEDYPVAGDGRDKPVAGQAGGKEAAYFALARRVAAFQKELSIEHDMPFDGSSVNAMTFSVFNAR